MTKKLTMTSFPPFCSCDGLISPTELYLAKRTGTESHVLLDADESTVEVLLLLLLDTPNISSSLYLYVSDYFHLRNEIILTLPKGHYRDE